MNISKFAAGAELTILLIGGISMTIISGYGLYHLVKGD